MSVMTRSWLAHCGPNPGPPPAPSLPTRQIPILAQLRLDLPTALERTLVMPIRGTLTRSTG